jgi:GIY-YIG catalytic domain
MNLSIIDSFSGQLTLCLRDRLPDHPGIYFVVGEPEQLFYIGQSKNLRKRWAGVSHHRYKQFARKGLDKIVIKYILASVSELKELECQYIEQFNPLLNDSKVKKYLPKTIPRFSELQRLLKLASQPLFPSLIYRSLINGQTILREPSDLFRGLVAGVYEDQQLHILVLCRQNMGELLCKSFYHPTKKHFYISAEQQLLASCYFFDARQVIFDFVELFDFNLADEIFQNVYPYLLNYEIAGVTLKGLSNPTLLTSYLSTVGTNLDGAAKDYLLGIAEKLQPLPANFILDKQLIL